jgi:biotin transport system substrate-specific component
MYALLFIGNVFVNQAPNRFSITIRCLIGFVIGTALCYLIGSIWLATLLHLSLTQAIAIGVLPYLAGDFLKIIFALKLGPLLQKRLALVTGDFAQ